jgi:hypothetical protein
MPDSARALGQEGLRLRSRRVRSNRSQRLSVQLVATVVVVVSLGGFIGASVADSGLRLPSLVIPGWMPGPSVAPSFSSNPDLAQQQQYLDVLLPIHSRLMQTVLRTGVATASFGGRDIDRAQFRAQLDESLASYRRIEEVVLTLQPPADLRDSHAAYIATVRLFERSATEMLKAYDDGDNDHLADGAPLSLEGMARMRTLSDRFWPR